MSNSKLELPERRRHLRDGRRLPDGKKANSCAWPCWDDADEHDGEPDTVYTTDFDNIRFTADGMAYHHRLWSPTTSTSARLNSQLTSVAQLASPVDVDRPSVTSAPGGTTVPAHHGARRHDGAGRDHGAGGHDDAHHDGAQPPRRPPRDEGGGPGRRLRHPAATADATTPKPLLPVGHRPDPRAGAQPTWPAAASPRRCCRSGSGPTPSPPPTPTARCAGVAAHLRRRARAARHGRRHPLRRRPRPASTRRSSWSTATCSPTSTSARWSRFHRDRRRRGHHPPHAGRGPVGVRRGAHRRPTAGSRRSSRSRRPARRPPT